MRAMSIVLTCALVATLHTHDSSAKKPKTTTRPVPAKKTKRLPDIQLMLKSLDQPFKSKGKTTKQPPLDGKKFTDKNLRKTLELLKSTPHLLQLQNSARSMIDRYLPGGIYWLATRSFDDQPSPFCCATLTTKRKPTTSFSIRVGNTTISTPMLRSLYRSYRLSMRLPAHLHNAHRRTFAERWVRILLLAQKAPKMRVSVENAEVLKEAVTATHLMKETNEARVRDARTKRFMTTKWFALLKAKILAQRVRDAIKRTVKPPIQEAKAWYIANKTLRTLSYIQIDPKKYLLPFTPSTTSVNKFRKEQRNQMRRYFWMHKTTFGKRTFNDPVVQETIARTLLIRSARETQIRVEMQRFLPLWARSKTPAPPITLLPKTKSGKWFRKAMATPNNTQPFSIAGPIGLSNGFHLPHELLKRVFALPKVGSVLFFPQKIAGSFYMLRLQGIKQPDMKHFQKHLHYIHKGYRTEKRMKALKQRLRQWRKSTTVHIDIR